MPVLFTTTGGGRPTCCSGCRRHASEKAASPICDGRPAAPAGTPLILKPARGKLKRGLKAGAAGLPPQIGDAAFSEACRLHPLQHVGRPPPVVVNKPGIPEAEERARHNHVDENKTPHGAGASWQKSYFL